MPTAVSKTTAPKTAASKTPIKFKCFSQWVDNAGWLHADEPDTRCAVCGRAEYLGREPVLGYVCCSEHRRCSPAFVQRVSVFRRKGRRISMAEYRDFRGNSWDHKALIPHMSDEVLVWTIRHAEKNCSRLSEGVPTTYEESMQLYAVEAARRLCPEEFPVSGISDTEDVISAEAVSHVATG